MPTQNAIRYTVYSTGFSYVVAPEQGDSVMPGLIPGEKRRYKAFGKGLNVDRQKDQAQAYADKLNGRA